MSGNLIDLVKQVIEIAMPDMRHHYRTTRKGKIVAVYPSEGGNYYADVKPLRNDDTEDENEPVVPKVEIPVMWGGQGRGVVCPPGEGALCDLSYYDGDPNYPRISNMRGNSGTPSAALNEFVIQLEPGVEIRIDAQKRMIFLTSADWKVNVEGKAEIAAKDGVKIDGNQEIDLTATNIFLNGLVSARNVDGGKTEMSVDGNMKINGDTTTTGNSAAGSRSGGSCPH